MVATEGQLSIEAASAFTGPPLSGPAAVVSRPECHSRQAPSGQHSIPRPTQGLSGTSSLASESESSSALDRCLLRFDFNRLCIDSNFEALNVEYKQTPHAQSVANGGLRAASL